MQNHQQQSQQQAKTDVRDMFKFCYEGIRTKSADIILVFSFSALNILSSNIYKVIIMTISNMRHGAFSQKQFRDFSRNFFLLENSNKDISQGSKYTFALTYFDSPSLSSSQRRCSIEIGVLRKFHKIIWEISVLEFLFDKVAGLQSCKVPTFKVKLNKIHRPNTIAVTRVSQV